MRRSYPVKISLDVDSVASVVQAFMDQIPGINREKHEKESGRRL